MLLLVSLSIMTNCHDSISRLPTNTVDTTVSAGLVQNDADRELNCGQQNLAQNSPDSGPGLTGMGFPGGLT